MLTTQTVEYITMAVFDIEHIQHSNMIRHSLLAWNLFDQVWSKQLINRKFVCSV